MNSTALAVIQPDELSTIERTGRMLAASGYFDAKGEGAQAIAMMATKILAGREIGIGPFAAVNGIHIIQGKPSIGANLLASAVKGSNRYDYRVREMTDKVCRIEFFERVGGKLESLGISEFTADDARKAQTKNMDKFPKNMLFARAMSNGVRFYTPDVFNGNAVYVPEELGADVDAEGNVVEVTPRRVDMDTGEILHDQPAKVQVEENGDVIFATEQRQTLSDVQFKHLHAAGMKLYGKEEWDVQRHKLVEAVTNKRTLSSRELTPAEADRLIKGIEKKQLEADAIKAQQAAAQETQEAELVAPF